MMQNGLFYSLNDELKKQFGTKIIKLSLDGGFTCPNRDGNCGSRGCIFCSEVGSGEHAGSRALSIHEQMQEQIALLRSKWPQAKYIALIGHLLTLVPAHVVIHRLTGDGDKNDLIAPRWILNKRYVLNGIQRYMREHGLYQGKNVEE